MKKLILWITEALMRYCERKGRVFHITGTAGPEDVYLIRYYVIQSRWFNVFIHQFLRSDRDDLHDHPWNFCTYLIRGSYTENKFNPDTGNIEKTVRVNKDMPYSYYTKEITKEDGTTEIIAVNQRSTPVRMNTFVFRKAIDQHQVVVSRDFTLAEKDLAPLTLFISGPTIREWGFVKEVTVQSDGVTPISPRFRPIREWIPWKKYLGLPDDAPNRG